MTTLLLHPPRFPGPTRRGALLRLAAGACAAAAPATLLRAAVAPPAGLYEAAAATADGIAKRYMGRPIARVMGYQGAAWLERDAREQEERGDLLLPELQLKPGLDVADVGAGTGYYTRRISPLVQPGGRVYAVDVQPEMVALLQQEAKRPGTANIVPVLGAADDVRLAPASIDLALFVDVYHELEFPFEVLASVVQALRPGGRVVLVEYRAEDPKVPIKALHKMSEAQVKREAAVHPLAWERTVETLPWQHIVVFRKTASR